MKTYTAKPLEQLDILITIFNQEEIIERVLWAVCRNTTTPFNLLLIFDGCTDKTKPRALAYLKKISPRLLRELIIHDTPNLFELRANNYGFMVAKNQYLITVQDDMVIREYGWERRLTYPLRIFDDVLAVTARVADDLLPMPYWTQKYMNRMAFEFGTLSRDVFAVRDVINRGPIAFNMNHLKSLGYLNDRYAPGALDDLELSLRAWLTKKLRVGAFGIRYTSRKEWSKVNAPDSTMKAWDSCARNEVKINEDFKDYIVSGTKHDEDITLGDMNVDYHRRRFAVLQKIGWLFLYPIRLDKRSIKTQGRIMYQRCAHYAQVPLKIGVSLVFGKRAVVMIEQNGIKKALRNLFARRVV